MTMVAKNGLSVSLSGIRGVWGKDLTPRRVVQFCLSASEIFKSERQKYIFIARDTRPSSRQIFNLVFNTLRLNNLKLIDLGILPVPILQTNVCSKENSGGVMITASHNPPEYNGLKFYQSDGKIFDLEQSEHIKKNYSSIQITPAEMSKLSFKVKTYRSPKTKSYRGHFDKIFNHIDINKIKNRSFNVIVDPGNGTGSYIDKIFLKQLGCQVKLINSKVDGKFRRSIEPISQNLEELKKALVDFKADLGFAQDCDADRLAVIDENGQQLEEEILLALVVYHFLKNKKGSNKKVVTNCCTSKSIDQIVVQNKGRLFKSTVGEINVTKETLKQNAIVGGEGNGGVIWPKIVPGRDSFSAMALVLELLSIENKPLSKIAGSLPLYCMSKQKVPWDRNNSLTDFYSYLKSFNWPEKISSVYDSDGLRLDFPDSWISIRSSTTEPVVRFIAEAKYMKQTDKLIKIAKSQLKDFQKSL